jgi:hypothetical protein
MPAYLALPDDQRVRDSVTRFGLAALGVVGPASVRERLAVPLTEADRVVLSADIDTLAVLLANGR